jgi:hypothetical protein
VQETSKQAALFSAVAAFCALQRLRAGGAAASLAGAGASEALMSACCALLAARRALTQHAGAFVKACLTRLSALLAYLRDLPQGDFLHTMHLLSPSPLHDSLPMHTASLSGCCMQCECA